MRVSSKGFEGSGMDDAANGADDGTTLDGKINFAVDLIKVNRAEMELKYFRWDIKILDFYKKFAFLEAVGMSYIYMVEKEGFWHYFGASALVVALGTAAYCYYKSCRNSKEISRLEEKLFDCDSGSNDT